MRGSCGTIAQRPYWRRLKQGRCRVSNERELGIDEEILERTVHPDGTVVERIVRRVARARETDSVGSPAALSHREARPALPIPASGVCAQFWKISPPSGSSLDAFGGVLQERLDTGLHSGSPWARSSAGRQGESSWIRWTTLYNSRPPQVFVDLLLGPPECPSMVKLRISATEPSRGAAIWNGTVAEAAAVGSVMAQLQQHLAGIVRLALA